MNLLITGAPGAGKGSVCNYLIKEFNLTHFSTGDMLREAVKNKTTIGLKASSYMDQGLLVPDAIVEELIEAKLNEDVNSNGFLFDGYPRTLNQAKALENILEKLNLSISLVLNLDVDDSILTKRIVGRRTCPNCKEIYNIYFKAPKISDKCDICGSTLTYRSDDNENSLKTRLVEYHKNANEVLKFYKEQGKVRDIDASKDSKEVLNSIEEILKGAE